MLAGIETMMQTYYKVRYINFKEYLLTYKANSTEKPISVLLTEDLIRTEREKTLFKRICQEFNPFPRYVSPF